MSPSPLPSHESSPLWSDVDDRRFEPPRDPGPPNGPSGPDRPTPHGDRPRRAPLAMLLVVSALLGGGTTAGVLAATGALGDDVSRTTVVQRETPSTAQDGGGGLDAEALYANNSAGVVDITVSSAAASEFSPFGGSQQAPSGSGTGFVVDDAGHIVTAAHVVDGASSISVRFQDGATRKATVLGRDDATDVAVLKVDAAGVKLHPLALGSSASLNVGDDVAAIGDPFGYDRSISTGIVSGVDRTIQAPNGFTVAHAIQTDAAMNPGNSGGPVFDAAGKVVGIADQIATNGGAEQSAGVGFAVPIDLVKSALPTLKAGGRVQHAYLGVATGGATNTAGATVSTVTPGGPAADAGLRAGDIVTAFDGKAVTDANELVAGIAAHKPGDEVKVTVKRGSRSVQLTVTLGTQPAQRGANG
jgi:putative serine protease PepD